jgi:glycosyltransferase involved in cell wall biosynthesis
MNILLINHYAGSIHHGMEYRPYYLAREWVRRGHRVHIAAATCSHLRQHAPGSDAGAGPWTEENIDGIRYLWLRTPSYRGNGAARVRNMLAFVARLWREAPRLARTVAPHAVIASSTYPLDIWPAHRIARLAGARLLHEVHDLWPLSPMELGGYSPRHPFIMLLQAAENHACRHADAIVSMLPKVREHLEARGMAPHKLHIIPNGADPDEWPAPAELPAGIAADRPMALGESVRKTKTSTGTASRSGVGSARRAAATGPTLTLVTSSPKTAAAPGASPAPAPARAAPGPASPAVATLIRSAGPPPAPAAPSLAQLPPELSRLLGQLREQGKTIVAYTGSHGLANALDTLLDAARLVHDQPLAFLLVGAGPEKERLQQQAQRRELAQVHFAAPVAKRHMPALLGNIDIAFLGWQRQPLYRFGIAPNKLLDYMMAGCPVLHAVNAGNDPVAEAGCGVSVAPEDPAALAHGLLRLLELGPEQRRLLGARGRRYALSHLTYPVLAQRFLNVLAQETSHG